MVLLVCWKSIFINISDFFSADFLTEIVLPTGKRPRGRKGNKLRVRAFFQEEISGK